MANHSRKVGRAAASTFSRAVGGELPLAPGEGPAWLDAPGAEAQCAGLFPSTDEENILWLRFGRSVIGAALAIAKVEPSASVALPAYQCKAVIEKIHGTGRSLEFYQLNMDLTPDRDNILSTANRAAAVLTCGYFGSAAIDESLSDMGDALWGLAAKPWIIEDRAMTIADADIAEQAKDRADFVFYSLRKSYPVPDGAPLIACSERAKAALLQWRKDGHVAAADTQSVRFNEAVREKIRAKVKRHGWINHRPVTDDPDKNGLKESIASEVLIDDAGNDSNCDGLPASPGSCSYVGKKNFTDDRQTVRAHSQKLIDGLINSLPDVFPIKDAIGIATPILVENREALLASAHAKGLFLPVHWPRDDRIPCGESVEHWYNRAVSLPTLPESPPEDTAYMIEQLSQDISS